MSLREHTGGIFPKGIYIYSTNVLVGFFIFLSFGGGGGMMGDVPLFAFSCF